MKFIRKNFLTLLLAVFVLISYFHDRPVLASGITPEQPLEAQWVPNAVKITFNSNGGGVAPKDQIYTYGIERSLPGVGNMIKEGYHVIGWAETADATSPKWPLGALSDDAFGYSDATQAIAKTLYAVWEEDKAFSGIIKSRQSGTTTVGFNPYMTYKSTTVSIKEVDVQKSILIMDTYSYPNYNYSGIYCGAYGTLYKDYIRFDVYTGNGSEKGAGINWQVIEFY